MYHGVRPPDTLERCWNKETLLITKVFNSMQGFGVSFVI